jgi:glycine/D-amino acid oxidase-like deaminating enzyme
MTTLLVVGGGLFGSLAAAYARHKGLEAQVFDPCLDGAASHAAAGLFKEDWAGRKLRAAFGHAISLLDRLYEVKSVSLAYDDGTQESFLFVPPTVILDQKPVRQAVTAVGDGWLEAGGRRYDGWVYVAAGVWTEQFIPGVGVYGRAGSSFAFHGEREGRIRRIGWGRQAIAFVRDPGSTHFMDGTAERDFRPEHDRQTLQQAADMGLIEPVRRFFGYRPYTPGGPVFERLGRRTWVATGGRKLGTVLGASFARRLVDEEFRS